MMWGVAAASAGAMATNLLDLVEKLGALLRDLLGTHPLQAVWRFVSQSHTRPPSSDYRVSPKPVVRLWRMSRAIVSHERGWHSQATLAQRGARVLNAR